MKIVEKNFEKKALLQAALCTKKFSRECFQNFRNYSKKQYERLLLYSYITAIVTIFNIPKLCHKHR